MATKQEVERNDDNNTNGSRCADILKDKPESESKLTCDECGDGSDTVVAFCKDRKSLDEIMAPVEMSENLSKAEADIVNTQQRIKEQATNIDQEIDKYYDEQLQNLNEHRKQLKQQLHEQLEEIKSVQDQLVNIKELRENLDKTSDSKVLSSRQEDVEDQVKKQLGHLCTDLTLEIPSVPNYVVIHRKVKLHLVSKDGKGKDYTRGGNKVVVQLKSSTGGISVGKITDNNDGSYVASLVPEQVGEAKLSVSINGEQIKGSPYSIVVRNYQAIDKPTKIINNDGSMGQPWGVAFGRNGLWAVANHYNHCVYIFDNKDQLVRKFGSKGSNNGQFIEPCGVAFDSHNHLYVVDTLNHRVQKFDTNGNYLLQFGSNGSGSGQLDIPIGIAVHKDKVYIADKHNKRVSVFQTDGKFHCIIGTSTLGTLEDVAVSADKYLFVAGHNPDCIYTFTLDGHYIGKFGEYGSGRCEFKGPQGISADLYGFIIVADVNNHRVSIFDKYHRCIHCFGSYGSANGQFRWPRGTAVSPNGSLYVCDFYNRRVQIFSDY